MPFVAIIMALGFSNIAKSYRFFSWFINTALMIYIIFSYLILNFGVPIEPNLKYALNFPLIGWTDIYYLDTNPVNLLYGRESWPQEKIINDLQLVTKPSHKNIFFAIDKPSFNSDNFNLALIIASNRNFSVPWKIQLISYNLYSSQKPEINWDDDNKIRTYFKNNIDYVLVAKKSVKVKNAPKDIVYMSLTNIQKLFMGGKETDFSIINTYPTPDGDGIIIYVNNTKKFSLKGSF
jgi:hypothetical protein